jgi:phosphoribosylglycinamide formyltransferase-1
MRNIVILISGGGSNMLAIAQVAQREHWQERFQARIACVISNRPLAGGLAKAADLGLATQVVDHTLYENQSHPREAFDSALMQAIDVHQPSLVVLAGFMRILTPGFVVHYQGRLLNIHPSLLPAFTGLNTHQRAMDAGCRFAGATVHQVTVDLDDGPILAQAVVPVMPGDTADSLAARVLTQEHLVYPRAIAEWLSRQP